MPVRRSIDRPASVGAGSREPLQHLPACAGVRHQPGQAAHDFQPPLDATVGEEVRSSSKMLLMYILLKRTGRTAQGWPQARQQVVTCTWGPRVARTARSWM
jgi:hypothetical protein